MKIILLCITFIAACKPIGDDASQTQGRDTYAWFKEPAVIRDTIVKTWGIEITIEDDIRYFARLGQLYGAVDPITARVLLREPSGTYVLALDMVSLWISDLLLVKQVSDESGSLQPLRQGPVPVTVPVEQVSDESGSLQPLGQGPVPVTVPVEQVSNESGSQVPVQVPVEPVSDESVEPKPANMLFHGMIGFSLDDLSDNYECFDDAKKKWCDADDKITTGMYSAKDKERLLGLLDPDLASSERKRLMHNIQDIGDFLGVTIDNLLTITDSETDSEYSHVPHYLLDAVFIPNLDDPLDDPPKCTNEKSSDNRYIDPLRRCDIQAWKQVVHTILMSGPFFMSLPNRSVGEAI